MEKRRYAIIGCGNISPKHLNGYSALKDQVEIVAYCDLIPEKMEKIPRPYNPAGLAVMLKGVDFFGREAKSGSSCLFSIALISPSVSSAADARLPEPSKD